MQKITTKCRSLTKLTHHKESMHISTHLAMCFINITDKVIPRTLITENISQRNTFISSLNGTDFFISDRLQTDLREFTIIEVKRIILNEHLRQQLSIDRYRNNTSNSIKHSRLITTIADLMFLRTKSTHLTCICTKRGHIIGKTSLLINSRSLNRNIITTNIQWLIIIIITRFDTSMGKLLIRPLDTSALVILKPTLKCIGIAERINAKTEVHHLRKSTPDRRIRRRRLRSHNNICNRTIIRSIVMNRIKITILLTKIEITIS